MTEDSTQHGTGFDQRQNQGLSSLRQVMSALHAIIRPRPLRCCRLQHNAPVHHSILISQSIWGNKKILIIQKNG